MKAKYIRTMDVDLDNVEITNCKTPKELENKIKENEVIEIKSEDETYYINSAYIMFYELDENSKKMQQIIEIEEKKWNL